MDHRLQQKLAIGIDLGTSYSCAAVWRHDQVEIIVNDQGNRTTPSYVAFTDTRRVVGDGAKNQAALNPTNTVFGNSPVIYIFFFPALNMGKRFIACKINK